MRFKLNVVCFSLLGSLSAGSIPVSKPEEVGLSQERLARIHETIQRHIDAKNISGAVTLVARKGKIAHWEAHGLMDLDGKKPIAKDSMFRIWSMTKPVAGVAILMLMEEGKVRLNDPVSKFIPEFRGQKVAVLQDTPTGPPPPITAQAPAVKFYTIPSAREITIQDLLTHVSGLGSGAASRVGFQMPKEDATLAGFIPNFAATPLDFQPGSKWAYSALAAFDTLGRVVEVASGQTFDVFLKQRIFDPLGMKETSFVPSADQMARVPVSYQRDGDALKKSDTMNRLFGKGYFSGGGGLFATTEDYTQFGEMLAEGGKLNGKRLLSPKTVELMASAFAPDTMPGRQPGRAFGLSVQVVTDPIAAGYRVSKGSFGWDGAYGTHFWVDPKEKLVGLLMIQTTNPNRQLDRDFESAVMQAIVE